MIVRDSLVDAPQRIAGEADMLPPERGHVLKQGRLLGLGFLQQRHGAFQIDRVPQGDGGDQEIQAAGAMMLVFEGTVSHFSKPVEKDRARASFVLRPCSAPR